MGRTIGQLPLKNAASLADGDLLIIEEATGGANKKTTILDIANKVTYPDINGATTEDPLAGTEEVLLQLTGAGAFRKTTVNDLKKPADLTVEGTLLDTDEFMIQKTSDGTLKKTLLSTISAKVIADIDASAVINNQTGTTYTLVAADNGKTVYLNNAAGITLTLPQQSTTTLSEGFQCTVVQEGAGQVTVALEGTDTLQSLNSATKLSGQHAMGYVILRTAASPNVWGFYGDISV
jgi:hypothetical protein